MYIHIHYLTQIYQETWIAYMRKFISIKWNCISDPDLILRIYEYWELILSDQIKLEIKTLVKARIENQISQCLNKSSGDQYSMNKITKLLTCYYPKIIPEATLQSIFKQKLRHFYLKSHFAKLNLATNGDQFASGLKIWQVNKKIFEKLQLTLIIPKLTTYLHEMGICPSNQNLAPLQTLFKYTRFGLLSYSSCFYIILQQFFPKWLRTLNEWLKQRYSRNKQQICIWFKGWREYLLTNLINSHSQQLQDTNFSSKLQTQFKMGLFMIKTNV